MSGDEAAVLARAHTATGWFLGGVAVMIAARAWTGRRRGRHIPVPLSLPAAFGALALGLVVQSGYGDPFRTEYGLQFAQGVFLASLAAALALVVPGDLGEAVTRARLPIAGGIVGVFLLLLLFGDAPGTSDQRINLWGTQPIEAVKIAATLVMAEWLGGRAAKLRWQRDRFGWLRLPRTRLLLGALAALASTWLGLLVVRDIGPTLILGLVFLGLFYVVTRSPGWVALAVASVAAVLGLLAWNPDLALSHTVAVRIRMWVDPWTNAIAGGDQLARAAWAMAAGGFLGEGPGGAWPGALPAGHTDLVYAHLVEELGQAGALVYVVLLTTTAIDALRVAAWNRTPERAMMAAGLGILLVAQALVILGGTMGAIPLTGVVVPFLSYGKTSTVAFVVVVALIVRLGEDGAARADTDELREIRAGVQGVRWGLGGLALILSMGTGWSTLWARNVITLRGVVTTQGDGTVVLQHDPRLVGLARRIRRGSILDRNGLPIAISPEPGSRIAALGDQLGTVLGPSRGDLLRPRWSLERQLDPTLRGWPDRAEPVTVTLSDKAGATRTITLRDPDLTPLLTFARMPLPLRVPALAALGDDVAVRTVQVTLDTRIQAAAAQAARAASAKSAVGAAAVVVLDAKTGETLARAQWPDFDPNTPAAWRKLRVEQDPKFMGSYGAWSDKTGAHGVWQAGSVFKVLTALLSVREGLSPVEGTECPTGAGPTFACDDVEDGRTSFSLDGWDEAIHDFGDGGAKGELDLVSGLTRSSNVYFAQLALRLGPEPYRKARKEGVEFGNPGLLEESDGRYTGVGEAGSRRLAQTGFGQGAGSWNVTQAARVAATVASGGTYRRCAADMLLGAPCAAVPVLAPGVSVAPILAGMEGVMRSGTGAKLAKVPGVRIYGKTGTADAPGTADEKPWGIRRGKPTRPHSWFVAIAESAEAQPCAVTDGTGRYVVAGVVPHGGFGAAAAGPMVIEVVEALQEAGVLPAARTP